MLQGDEDKSWEKLKVKKVSCKWKYNECRINDQND